jgi:hypothetical protein
MHVCVCMCMYQADCVLIQAYKDPMHAYDHRVAITGNICKAIVKTIHQLEIDLGLPRNTTWEGPFRHPRTRISIQSEILKTYLVLHVVHREGVLDPSPPKDSQTYGQVLTYPMIIAHTCNILTHTGTYCSIQVQERVLSGNGNEAQEFETEGLSYQSYQSQSCHS